MAYRAEALELQRQLRSLQTQFDMLSGQASALIQGRRARVAATSTVNGHLTTIDDSLSARNLQVVMNKKVFLCFICIVICASSYNVTYFNFLKKIVIASKCNPKIW